MRHDRHHGPRLHGIERCLIRETGDAAALAEMEVEGEAEQQSARHDSAPVVRDQAASDWCAWEDTHVKLHPDAPSDPRYEDPRFRLAFSRLVTHYWRHAAWLGEHELVQGMSALNGIRAVLIHGRQDVGSPLDVPWTLARRWPSSQLIVIKDSGHRAEAPTTEAIIRATDRFARS
jgi:proline iminopeptidase